MGALYFIRHGETDWNREGRLQGRIDTDLNPRGRRQAAEVAAALEAVVRQDLGPAGLNELRFYASPLKRTQQTLTVLLGALNQPEQPVALDMRLAEIGFGIWEGKTWHEIRARDPINHRDREQDRWRFAPPGGESYADVAERVRAWLDESDRPCCVVSHGGIARVMMHVLGGLSEEEAVFADVWQGRVLHFTAGGMRWLPAPGHA